jgi:hypothetical protein
MRTAEALALALGLLASVTAAQLPAGKTLIVSPGSSLSSLAAARDVIRAIRRQGQTGPVTVQIRGGVYRVDETFVLKPEDSNVTYTAWPGEHPVFSGGHRIEGWQKSTGSIWTAPAPFYFRQLFINGRRALRARTPTNGFYRIDGPSSQDKPFLLKFRGDDIRKSWAGRDVEAVALLAWAEIRMPIVEVDETAHTARLTADPRPSNKEKDARYWIENTPDALDSPGEWYLDRQAGTVSYWPVAGEDLTRDEVIAPALLELVRIEGQPDMGQVVRDVVFRGLDFRHADWTMDSKGYADVQAAIETVSAFSAVGAENVTIDHCAFQQSGGYAIWFGRGSKHNRVLATEIFDMGAGGIKIGETTTRPGEAEQNFEHTIADNDIHDLGLVYPPAVGIWIGQSSRNVVSHNHVHDLFYTAISAGWTWGYRPNQCRGNIIEYNHLHHIGRDMLSDMGGVYTLGEQPGTVIRNNLIHDVSAFTYGGWGIYPDEGSSDMLIESNIVYRTKSAGFHQHYGRENIVRNNIFAFGQEYQLIRSRPEAHVSFTLEGNIIYYDSGKLLGGNWSGDQFRMRRNVYWDARGEPVAPSAQDVEPMIADPLFANARNYDFTLLPKSPAWTIGWKTIDMTTVGPRVAAGP